MANISLELPGGVKVLNPDPLDPRTFTDNLTTIENDSTYRIGFYPIYNEADGKTYTVSGGNATSGWEFSTLSSAVLQGLITTISIPDGSTEAEVITLLEDVPSDLGSAVLNIEFESNGSYQINSTDYSNLTRFYNGTITITTSSSGSSTLNFNGISLIGLFAGTAMYFENINFISSLTHNFPFIGSAYNAFHISFKSCTFDISAPTSSTPKLSLITGGTSLGFKDCVFIGNSLYRPDAVIARIDNSLHSANIIISNCSSGGDKFYSAVSTTSKIGGLLAITGNSDFIIVPSDNDNVTVLGGTSAIIDVGDLAPWDENEIYLVNEYVSYVNPASLDPQFQTEAIYRCSVNTLEGESPETDPLKWVFLGTSYETTSGTSVIFVNDISNIKSVTGYANGHGIINTSSKIGYTFNSSETSLGDDVNYITPSDITEPDPGRWVKVIDFISERENTTTSITLDAQTTTVDFSAVQVESLTFDDLLTTHTVALSNLSTTERYNTIVIDNSSNTVGLTVTFDDQTGAIQYRNAKNEFPGTYPNMNVAAGAIWEVSFENRSATLTIVSFDEMEDN